MADVTHESGELARLAPRRVTPETLSDIDRELRRLGDRVEWKFQDISGEHQSQSLESAREASVWNEVTRVRASGWARWTVDGHDFGVPDSRVDLEIPRRGDCTVVWTSSSPISRHDVERTYRRVCELLEGLPRARWGGSAFARLTPVRWWDLSRAPGSMADNLGITLVGTIAGTVIATYLVTRFLG